MRAVGDVGSRWTLAFACVAVLASSTASANTTTQTGTIASGAHFDLYSAEVVAGTTLEVRLICDETVPGNGNRTLDPLLSIDLPGQDPTSSANASFFNDDGFGQEDHPEGVDCNEFDSSRLHVRAPETGTYTFRADGFASATGPYTLRIVNVSRTDLDFDGDDKADLGVFRQATGRFYVLGSFTNELKEYCCASTAGGDGPLVGDYDFDLRTDLAVHRASTNQYLIRYSQAENSSGAAEFVEVPTFDQEPDDIPAPADYDGDQVTDLAVMRASGEFVVARTSDFTIERTWLAVAPNVTGFVVPHAATPWGRPVWVAIYRKHVRHQATKNSDIFLRVCAGPWSLRTRFLPRNHSCLQPGNARQKPNGSMQR